MPLLPLVAVILVTVASPRVAHAIAACTAAQIIANDGAAGRCPAGTGACNIGKNFEIGDGCTLDFGTRAVTILGTSKIDIASGTVNIKAGTFSIAPQGSVEGRGNLATPPRDRGGFLTITTTGAVNIQHGTSTNGVIDVSGNTRAGTVNIVAGGSITVSGIVIANGLTTSGGNGVISLRSTGGDFTSGSLSTITATAGDFSTGGFIDIAAAGRADIGTNLVANGGDGGVIDVLAKSGEVIVRGMNASGSGDAGSGGCTSATAGTRLQMLGPVVLNGTGSATQSGGGCGGFIDMEARFGDATINSPITAESGAPDGGGGGISVLARGSITTAVAAALSVQGQGQSSCGGEISLESDLDIFANGSMNASGGFGGNLIDVIAGRNAAVNGMVDARGRDGGGFGGSVTMVAGDRGFGNLDINTVVDAGGGLCSTINGCGIGGFTELSGCNLTVSASGEVDATGADGGDNLLVAREKLTVNGMVDARTTSGMTNGTNTFQHPSRVAPTIVAANVTPPATIQALATCTAALQTGCLVPCPVCGNGMVEFPETCDQSGNTANCDGCTSFCRAENCNDNSPCTTDTCDATLGCRNLAVTDGTSCTDNNVCNGVEVCTSGICRAPAPGPNCNDNNQCTTDSCNPTLGCQNPASPVTQLCNDGNVNTCSDHCDGAKACVGGTCPVTTTTLPPTTTTTTLRPTTTTLRPTTTSTTLRSTTTSTTAPVPTTTSTTSPIPTSTSTSVRPTTTSTTAPPPTTTSTTAPVPTTTSTTAPVPTTTSTSSPIPTSTSTTVRPTTTSTSSSSTSSTSSSSTSSTSTTSPVPTTTSTSVPGATTTSTTAPLPTTTSSSVPGTTSTSTSVRSTTTSTSTVRPTTTSTTIVTGCVPADCNDGNACTTDICQGGTCVHQSGGFDAVSCELAKLTTGTANLCAPDPIYAKLANTITVKTTKARNLVGRAENNTASAAQKLLARALKQLVGLRSKVARAGERHKITDACRVKLDSLLADRVALLQGLSTP